MRVNLANMNRARAVVARLDEWFSDKTKQSTNLWRGDARALSYAMKLLNRLLEEQQRGVK